MTWILDESMSCRPKGSCLIPRAFGQICMEILVCQLHALKSSDDRPFDMLLPFLLLPSDDIFKNY